MLTEDLLFSIEENTNLYAKQKGCSIEFTADDILAFIGMDIAMGITCLPEIADYWAQEPILRSPRFPSVMTLKKFKAISRYPHFADNSKALSRDDSLYDKLWKVRNVIDSIDYQSQKVYTPGMHVSVDESMIGTKGCLSFLQYMPKKPTKWGIKVWVCCESQTGYICKYQVYTGKAEHCEHGLAYRVVMEMMEELLDEGRVVYVDNFYTSPTLFRDLYARGMYASGTVRSNRKHFPAARLDEGVKKKVI